MLSISLKVKGNQDIPFWTILVTTLAVTTTEEEENISTVAIWGKVRLRLEETVTTVGWAAERAEATVLAASPLVSANALGAHQRCVVQRTPEHLKFASFSRQLNFFISHSKCLWEQLALCILPVRSSGFQTLLRSAGICLTSLPIPLTVSCYADEILSIPFSFLLDFFTKHFRCSLFNSMANLLVLKFYHIWILYVCVCNSRLWICIHIYVYMYEYISPSPQSVVPAILGVTKERDQTTSPE